MSFLAALPIPKLLPSASSSDILKFLIWKDKSGRTKVHQISCPEISKQKASSCECPSRLSAGTVDSLIGKLRAVTVIWVSPCFGYPHTQIPSEMGIPGRDTQNTDSYTDERLEEAR